MTKREKKIILHLPHFMELVYITRKEHFNAAHRLFLPELSDEENLQVFGKCSNPNWHGHNYTLLVTVKGEVNRKTGFVANLKDLSTVITDRIISKMDHRNVNLEVDFMKGKLASTENMAIAIWNELESEVKKMKAILHCIRLEETEKNSVEYYGG